MPKEYDRGAVGQSRPGTTDSRGGDGESSDPVYVFVTGGVMSGLGKGITAASLGRLLLDRGYSVDAVKVDPYLNVDAGTMAPAEHGEVYVLNDGTEVDLDLGNYERFLQTDMAAGNNITTGKVYQTVIEKERSGDYLGETVQIIPHITDEIKEGIHKVAAGNDFCLIEVGGTVGDIEGMPFLESIRQLKTELGESKFLLAHVTLIPHSPNGEQKTKPTQHSIKELRSIGIRPDMIVGRCSEPLTDRTKEKIALFGDLPTGAVISNSDVEDIYRAPLQLRVEGFDEFVLENVNPPARVGAGEPSTGGRPQPPSESDWEKVVSAPKGGEISIALVGKYEIEDSYMSVVEAVNHAAMNVGVDVELNHVLSEGVTDPTNVEEIATADGVIIPGGFDERGVGGKISTAEYARRHDIPTLGLCLGFQVMVIEYARNVCGLTQAHSTEFDDSTPHPVIAVMPEQYDVEELGGTMRLGSYTATVKEGTLAESLYGESVSGRHRHRYEVNPEYIERLESPDTHLRFSAQMNNRMEIVELDNAAFYFGTQFHPEYGSRPTDPRPAYVEFLRTARRQ